ncbi:hypothetical protein FSP39_024276 [Pinctada imbricata]|uniref:Uncharacterized protein n=1 Tax=Pinctada imbricata TaxID=66713 RepID=A0AA88YG24_PINIB|nr:hypothetical protein FSP39_024276 [Pinctada imbricata]
MTRLRATVCVMIYHRSCLSVDTIENASKSLIGSTTLSQCQDNLKQREHETIEQIHIQSYMISNLENDVVKVSDEISHLAKSIVDKVKTLEENCIQNAINETAEQVEKLQSNRQRLESQAVSLKQFQGTIAVSEKHGSEISLFIQMKRAQMFCDEICARAASNITLNVESPSTLIFEKDSKVLELQSSLFTLGKVRFDTSQSENVNVACDEETTSKHSSTTCKSELKALERESREADFEHSSTTCKSEVKTLESRDRDVDFEHSSTTCKSEFKALERGDAEVNFMAADPIPQKVFNSPLGAEVSGIVFIDADRFIVADRSNPRCILTDVNGKVRKVFKLEANPFGIDYLNETEIVISFRKRKFVQKLDTTSLKLGQKIPLLYPCTSLASSENSFVYASSDQVIHRFDAQGTDEILTKCNGSYCVAVSKDRIILYANLCESALIAVSDTGQEKYRYSHSKLKSPFNVTLDDQGNSYVIGLESRNLHQISADGTQGRVLLEDKVGGGHTCCIKFKPKSNVFLTASENGTKLTFYEMK